MPKTKDAPEQFPVTLSEFAAALPKGQIETRRAFADAMANEPGRRPPGDWQALYTLFQNKPAGVPWDRWRAQNGR